MEKEGKIGYINNMMSKIMSEWANDKKYRTKYVDSYDLLKKPSLSIQKSHIIAKKKLSLT